MTLSVDNLSFSYGEKPVLSDLSFQVDQGAFCVLLGSNGAGKSTLLKCINGVLPIYSGTISIAGKDISSIPGAVRAKLFSLLPQEDTQTFPFLVEDIVVMGKSPYLRLYESPQKEHYQEAYDVLKLLGGGYLLGRQFNQLSRGEKQIVLLARSFLQSTKTLLLDEPTNHLDFKNTYLLLENIKRLCQHFGTRVVAAIHDPNIAARFADQAVLMKNGKVLDQGEITDVMTQESIMELYDFPVQRSYIEGQGYYFTAAFSARFDN